MSLLPREPRKPRLRNQAGQILVIWLVFMLPMVVLCFSVYNVGVVVSEKMKVQTAADNAAYSAATWNARYMNQMAYLNRTIVANYDTIAALTGIWSMIDGLDGFVGLIRTLLRVFFNIGEAITPAAKALHKANDAFSNVVGGGKKNKKVGAYLEGYNKVLSFAQQGLYIANQIGRGRVTQSIAWGVDPKIEYWLESEIWGIQEIANRRDWKKSDKDKGLRLTLERSLNKLSNGDAFRDLDNFPIVGTLIDIINLIPCFEITIGPEGFDGPGFDHVKGGGITKGKVKIANDEKIYQLDYSGLRIDFDCIVEFTLIGFGHYSDDKKNLPNNFASGFPGADLAFPHIIDEEGDHGEYIKRNVDCNSAQGKNAGSLGGGATQDPKLAALGEAQKKCGKGDNPFKAVDVKGDNPPDLPPGPVTGSGIGQTQPPFVIDVLKAEKARQDANKTRPADDQIPASVQSDDMACYDVQQQLEERQNALKKNLKNSITSSGTCATIFEFDTPLGEREVTHYIQKDGVTDGVRLEGPSVLAYVRKQGATIPIFRGLGLRFSLNPNDFLNIEAYAFGRAYYTQRPGGGPGDKETAFNPFWAGRLEKGPSAVFFH